MNQKITKKIQKDYDLIASDYSLKRSHPGQKMRQMSVYLGPNMRILDLGCGNGRFFELVPKGCTYVGLDFSEKLLKIAQKKYPGAKFVYGDMTNPKSWKNLGKFDRIFSFASFHHLINKNEQQKVLNLCFQALKPKGLLIIIIWNLWKIKHWPLHVKHLALKKLTVPYRLSNGKKAVGTINRLYYAFTPWELKKLISQAGFAVQSTFWVEGTNIFNAKELGIISKKC